MEMREQWKRVLTAILGGVILLALCSSPALAGKYGAEFLHLGVGARPLGMGGAFVAMGDDATASYWNPAGLPQMDTNLEISLTHVDMFRGLGQYHSVSLGLKVQRGTAVGLSWIRLGVDDIPKYAELEGSQLDRRRDPELRSTGVPEGYFSDVENGAIFSFAREIEFDLLLGGGLQPTVFPTQLLLGVNYKYIRQTLLNSTGRGQDLDIGAIVKINTSSYPRRSLSLGVNLQNISQAALTWDTKGKRKDQIRRNVKAGFGYRGRIELLDTDATFAFGIDYGYRRTTHYGAEFWIKEALALRVGSRDGDLTAGAGFNISRFSVDYAFVAYELSNVHRISGAVKF